jgi:sugar lactone lactonase YvrE
LFHVFPNIVNDATPAPGVQFVPTSLALDKHGDVYVGGLAGEAPGQGQVVKLDGRTGDVEKTWTGFTTVTGVAVGHDGSLYVSQLFAPQAHPVNPMIQGVLTKVSKSGKHHDVDVPFPAGVAVDKWGTVFVSAFSIAPEGGLAGAPAGVDTSGQIWRLRF